jgi:dipeptidyl aminopeptidase/acylaminoacyl peptidase
MKAICLSLVVMLAVGGCGRRDESSSTPASRTVSLPEARKGFHTKLVRDNGPREPLDQPPPGVFRIVHFDAPPGKLAAYLSPDPRDGAQHPAIIWITGGDCNSIGDVWRAAAASNDQTAAAYRQAGILMMFPSLRGGNDNPGVREGFLGEVDDVLAAADFLAKEKYVDPGRLYLGGHSTGGTLVLLVAECSDRFRAVFSFGPADDVRGYGPEYTPFDRSNPREAELRSPGLWLASIKSPTFVFEGTERGNIGSLQVMALSSSNSNVHFLPVQGANHFSILAPTNRLIADRILHDTGPVCHLAFTEQEVSRAFAR